MTEIDVLISEVGPRDGLQSIDTIMSTEHKKEWIKAEAESGVREIEVGSFVPAKLSVSYTHLTLPPIYSV